MKLRWALLAVMAFSLAVGTAAAQDEGDVYDNGPTNGTTDAWTINSGFTVSNTFTLTQNFPIVGLTFAAWLFPGDILETVEVSITSSEFGGTTYFDQTVPFTQSGCTTNQFGFDLCTETGTIPNVELDAGTYWLNLQNAVVNSGDPVYWDENSGPSRASQNSVGTIPSESFTIIGSCVVDNNSPGCGPPPPQTTPEPSSFLLFGSGVLPMLGAARRFLH
jgi:hypothetical protein